MSRSPVVRLSDSVSQRRRVHCGPITVELTTFPRTTIDPPHYPFHSTLWYTTPSFQCSTTAHQPRQLQGVEAPSFACLTPPPLLSPSMPGKRPHSSVDLPLSSPTRLAPPPPSPPPRVPFPLRAVTRHLRESRSDDVHRIGGGAPVYLTAVLEYLTTELVDAAAKEAKRTRTEQLPDDSERGVGGEEGEEGYAEGEEGDGNAGEEEVEGLWASNTIRPSHLASLFASHEQWSQMIQGGEEWTEDSPPPPWAHSTGNTPLTAPLPATNEASASALFPSLSFSPLTDAVRAPVLSRPAPAPPSRGGGDERGTSGVTPSNGMSSSVMEPPRDFLDIPVPSAPNWMKCRPSLSRSRGWAGGKLGNTVPAYTTDPSTVSNAHNNPYETAVGGRKKQMR